MQYLTRHFGPRVLLSIPILLLLSVSLGVLPASAQRLLIDKQQGKVGETVIFTVSLDNTPKAIDALGLELTYNPEVLRYTGSFTKGPLVQNFDFFDVNERTSGRIRVGGFTTKQAIAQGTQGDVVSLTFTVQRAGNTTIQVTRLVDDLAGLATSPGTFVAETASGAPPTPGTPPVGQTESAGEVLARVNGHPITVQDFEDELRRMRRSTKQSIVSVQDKQQILDQLIARELLFQEGKRQRLDQSDALIKQRLASLVLQHEVYKKINANDFTEAELQHYFDTHRDALVTEEEVRLREILVRVPPQADDATKAEARQKAHDLREKVVANPANFAQLAQEFSQGPQAKHGSDLNYVTRRRLPPEVAEVAFALKVNEISPVVETRLGYHILQVIDKRGGIHADWKASEANIRQALYVQKTKALTEELTARLRQAATVTVNTGLLSTSGPPPTPESPKPLQRGSRLHVSPQQTLRDVSHIVPEQVKHLLESGAEVLVVDVRSAAAFQQGHIPGALSMPLSEIDKRHPELPHDKEIVTYCA